MKKLRYEHDFYNMDKARASAILKEWYDKWKADQKKVRFVKHGRTRKAKGYEV